MNNETIRSRDEIISGVKIIKADLEILSAAITAILEAMDEIEEKTETIGRIVMGM